FDDRDDSIDSCRCRKKEAILRLRESVPYLEGMAVVAFIASGVAQGFRSCLLTKVTLMTSQAKIESCRRNGAKSRGPKTPETRERVCMNAYKHGIRSKREALAREQSCELENRKLKWMAKVDASDDMGEFLAYHTVCAQVEIEQAQQAIAERIE